jgi:uncharacterized short protein YbdD (DUF466 family)
MKNEHDDELLSEATPPQINETPNEDDTEFPQPDKTPKEPTVTPPKRKKRTLAIILSIVGGVILIALAAVAIWWFYFKTAPVADTPSDNNNSVSVPEGALERFITPTTGETWYDEPVAISDQGFFPADNPEDSKFFEVGKRGDNVIIMSETQGIGIYYQLFEESPEGAITAIVQPNSHNDQTFEPYFAEKVVVDATIHYDSLSIPPTLEVNAGDYVTAPEYSTIGSLINPAADGNTSAKHVTIKELGASKLIRIEAKNADSGLTTFYYAVDLPSGTRVDMTYAPTSIELAGYSWNDNEERTGTISPYVRGCGATGISQTWASKLTDADFIEIAKNDKDQSIYGLKSASSAVVGRAYDDYVQARDYMNDDKPILTRQEFFQDHAVIAYKNYAGEWLLYTQDVYALVGGCGKPVVYLYPTKTQVVDVRVGADVTVSDPFYNPSTGWQNVTAQPNGQLSYKGISYDSLFWEGTGYGAYPPITSGTVVPRAQAESTIRVQLAAQGLNQKESADFIEFWAALIPNKPYVQLAWFSTVDLNELAPLYISPEPKTLIRVFLDMRGLDEPIDLPEPQFSAPTRDGFTVVEWGGLLSGKP